MLKIRLQRVGRKHDPSFRIVVTDSRNAAKRGLPAAIVGSYDARANRVALKADEVKSWISKGAQVSPTVHNLLVSQKVIEGKKINVLPKKTAPVKEAPVVEAVAPVVAAPVVAEEVVEAETPAPEAPVETEATPETTEAAA